MLRMITLVTLLAVATGLTAEGEQERIRQLAQALSDSEHWRDRFAVAMISHAPGGDQDGRATSGVDAGALYAALLKERPENSHLIYRALDFCAAQPTKPICQENLVRRYQDSRPGDGLPFMINAELATRDGDDATLWESLSAAATAQRISSYFAREVQLFLEVLDRHPGLLHLTCADQDCGPNAVVAAALGFALAQVDYSFTGAKPCAQREDLTGSQITHCVKVARLLQQSTQYVNVAIGIGIEMKLLGNSIENPERAAELEARKSELERLARAGQAAQDKLDFINDEAFARKYLSLMASDGELHAFAAAAEMAGIDVDNPPPYCVTRADYEAMVEMIAEENIGEVEFPPICEDLD